MIIMLMLVIGILGVYLTAYVAYQSLLFLANTIVRDPETPTAGHQRRFNVLIPAHNEELYLPRLLASLRSQDYPAEKYRVTVIADNCSDKTVDACRTFDVDVIERFDPERRGKGYAIGWALGRLDLNRFNAVVVVDSDSIVDRSLLRHLNLQMERGDKVIQCYNGVANPGQSWFTRLMHVSRTIANEILHPGKRKLGLSSHLMGNGMCFDVEVLQSFGWNAFSVGEDWEYYARLIIGGTHIGYSRHARVYHQESLTLRQASSQRLRWSGSRFQVLRRYAPALFSAGIRRRDLKCLDASLPLIFPNPSLGINLTFLGLALSALLGVMTETWNFLIWYSVLAAAQLLLFLIGVLYTEDRTASALSIVLAPAFLAWKLAIDVASFGGAGVKQWKPTERKLL